MQRLKRMIRLAGELWVQKRCLLTGHDPLTEYGPVEIFERCQRCRRRSDGWQRSGARPRQRFEGDPARHVLQPWDLPARPVDFAADPSPMADTVPAFQPVAFVGTYDEVRLLLAKTTGVH